MDIEQVRAEIASEVQAAAELVGEGTLEGPTLWDFVNLVENCWYEERPALRRAWRYSLTLYLLDSGNGSTKNMSMADGYGLSSWLLKQDDTCGIVNELVAQALDVGDAT